MSNEKVLANFKKANKEARARMAKKHGYTNPQDYLAILTGNPKPPKKQKEKAIKTAHNVNILDVSGSMGGGKIINAVKGLNDETELLKQITDVNWTSSLVHFSSWNDIITEFWKKPVKNVPRVASFTRGMTALNDAIGDTITRLMSDTDGSEHVLVKIFTDGGENDSKRWRPDGIKALIKTAEARNITVTFVGASEEDIEYAENFLGVDSTNTLLYENNEKGVASASVFRSASTMNYSAKIAKGEDVQKGFYKNIKK